jgi:hypothetical protein
VRTAATLVAFAAIVATGFAAGAAIGDLVGPLDVSGATARDHMAVVAPVVDAAPGLGAR